MVELLNNRFEIESDIRKIVSISHPQKNFETCGDHSITAPPSLVCSDKWNRHR